MRVGSRVMQTWPLHLKGRVGTVTGITGMRHGGDPEVVTVAFDDEAVSIHADNLAGMDAEVRTTYSGPTDTRGSRITVRGSKGQRTFPYDYSAYCPHTAAAERYAAVLLGMTTSGSIISYTRSRRGYVIGLAGKGRQD